MSLAFRVGAISMLAMTTLPVVATGQPAETNLAGAFNRPTVPQQMPKGADTVPAASPIDAEMPRTNGTGIVETDREVVVERTMVWSTTGRFGSHSERAVNAPSTTWFFAEVVRLGGFDTFYKLENPSATRAEVEIVYLLPAGAAPIVTNTTVDPFSRKTVYLDEPPSLSETDVSALITVTNGIGILAERALYRKSHDTTFYEGHSSAGVTAAGTNWFLAEGATGTFFDLDLLLANPQAVPDKLTVHYLRPRGAAPFVKTGPVLAQSRTTLSLSNVWNLSEGPTGFFAQRLALSNPDSAPAEVSIKYLRSGGEPPVTRDYTVPSYGRLTINVNDIEGFATEDVSAVISSISGGVFAERTMFWGDQVYGGHTGKATQGARQQWFFAEGAASFSSTFILLANANKSTVYTTLTFLRQDTPQFTLTVDLAHPRPTPGVEVGDSSSQNATLRRQFNGASATPRAAASARRVVQCPDWNVAEATGLFPLRHSKPNMVGCKVSVSLNVEATTRRSHEQASVVLGTFSGETSLRSPKRPGAKMSTGFGVAMRSSEFPTKHQRSGGVGTTHDRHRYPIGNVRMHVPDRIVVTEPFRAVISVNPDYLDSLTPRLPRDVLLATGVRLTDTLQVRLAGAEDAFRIRPLTAELQQLRFDSKFIFEVTALKPGQHNLDVIIGTFDEPAAAPPTPHERIVTAGAISVGRPILPWLLREASDPQRWPHVIALSTVMFYLWSRLWGRYQATQRPKLGF